MGAKTSAWRLVRHRLHFACDKLFPSAYRSRMTSHYKAPAYWRAFLQAISIRQKETACRWCSSLRDKITDKGDKRTNHFNVIIYFSLITIFLYIIRRHNPVLRVLQIQKNPTRQDMKKKKKELLNGKKITSISRSNRNQRNIITTGVASPAYASSISVYYPLFGLSRPLLFAAMVWSISFWVLVSP